MVWSARGARRVKVDDSGNSAVTIWNGYQELVLSISEHFWKSGSDFQGGVRWILSIPISHSECSSLMLYGSGVCPRSYIWLYLMHNHRLEKLLPKLFRLRKIVFYFLDCYVNRIESLFRALSVTLKLDFTNPADFHVFLTYRVDHFTRHPQKNSPDSEK